MAKKAGVYIADEHAKLSAQEEMLMGQWTNRIPVVSHLGRSAVAFLNKMRFDTFLAMSKTLTKDGKGTPEELQMIAQFVNQATGRGELGRFAPAGVLLGRTLFAPRYVLSRFQLLTGQTMWKSGAHRKVIAREYARIAIGLGLYTAMLTAYFNATGEGDVSLETDPRATDFGKIRVGDTRVDVLSGLSQVGVLMARMFTGEIKNGKGEIKKMNGEGYTRDARDVASDFGWSKAHPTINTIFNLRSGKDLVGDDVTLMSEAIRGFTPLVTRDIYAALEEQGLPRGSIMALLAFIGEGVQTYSTTDSGKKAGK